MKTICNTCGKRGTDDLIGHGCTSCSDGVWVEDQDAEVMDTVAEILRQAQEEYPDVDITTPGPIRIDKNQ